MGDGTYAQREDGASNKVERRLRARIGGLALAAQRDPLEYTSAARRAFLNRFEQEADPNGNLPEPERQRRALALRRLHFARLALKSAKSRATKKIRRGQL